MSEARAVSEQEEARRIAERVVKHNSPAEYGEHNVLARAYLDLLEREQVLREALEYIAKEWEGNLGTGQMLTEFCRAALVDQEVKGW